MFELGVEIIVNKLREVKGMKEQFIKIYIENIKRPGAQELLSYLIDKTDIFTAPASRKYHGAYAGGLIKHSLNVYKRLLERCDGKELERNETLAIVALLHDLCKTNFYAVSERNVRKEDGTLVNDNFYNIDDKLPLGHGEKSIFIISQYMKLTIEEAMCIRWHMGGFDDSAKGGSYGLRNAWAKYQLAAKLHVADLLATYCDEERSK